MTFYPLDDTLQRGMIPLAIFALCSALSTFTLLSWITYRLIFKNDYQAFVGYNQYVILIYNLLLADLQQALSFLITLNWLKLGGISSPGPVCFTQAWLLNMGDVSSGFFVFAIALHTWYSVVLGRKLNYRAFTAAILGIWLAAFILTAIGPITKGPHFYAKTNAWCWVDTKYDLYRLWVHYLWVFIVELGTIIIYAHVFIRLRSRLNSIRSVHANGRHQQGKSNERLSQAARYMILYPIIYIVLTLPLAAGRMAAMSGKKLPISYYCMAGSFLTSCGWLDTLLYTLTRRVFVKPERPQTAHSAVPSATANSSRHLTGGRSAHGSKAPPMPINANYDPNWPLSTFASMTVDFDKHDDLNDEVYIRVGTPLQMDDARTAKKLALAETTIRATASEAGSSDESDRIPFGNGILSETRIEVSSMSRDEIIEHNFIKKPHQENT